MTLTRTDLAKAVQGRVSRLSRTECAQLVEATLTEIVTTLGRGEPVKISSFGAFKILSKNERLGRNPKTGVEVPVTPRKVISFSASPALKQRVQKGCAEHPATRARRLPN